MVLEVTVGGETEALHDADDGGGVGAETDGQGADA